MIKMNENMLKQIIINTIKGEEHLGDNLKRLCVDYIEQQENKQLKDIRETAINYIDQVIGYKPCAREIDEELNTLIGILRGDNNDSERDV